MLSSVGRGKDGCSFFGVAPTRRHGVRRPGRFFSMHRMGSRQVSMGPFLPEVGTVPGPNPPLPVGCSGEVGNHR